MADFVKVERAGGGISPFGSPNAKIKGEGELPISALSDADKSSLDALFKAPSAPAGPVPRLRLTRHAGGKIETVEVPEDAVPASLQRCVKDKLL